MFKSILFPFPLPLTTKQWIYIAGTQCLIAGFVDGGANFGIAYAMYHGQKDVRMWVFSKVSSGPSNWAKWAKETKCLAM
jgi:hypothetical protein